MTVDPAEAWITGAGEVAAALADAASPRATDVGGDLPHSGRVVGRHGNGAAVDGCERTRSDFIGREGGLARRAQVELMGGLGGSPWQGALWQLPRSCSHLFPS